ncbi:non-hydrolyzing UDP-N-acetylglucosamine 2-epimerase [Rhodococcus rhodochrous]|uniref:non-hydrolyzing UDP-N-acetylglucosamine 2-epimerase n=1 Tax=Rhodococcus rhodochrous TaxID=1829 RepID=UPI001780C992|nr:UDP-N-acetylglucosamine 2-epimerase (non-hydrolyzing) [Rhodococcus rhodochrous]QOH58103.1 UDP-N-acetylglucosamine 2-epimerase (non-hydrolyzing) [Rhodococcus rhodochrous]
MKVMTIVGTRPEIIRLSATMKLLDRTVNHVLVHTGQNYDYTLNGVFFDEMGLRAPDHFLNVDTSSLGSALGGILIGAEKVIQEERPDAVLVLGDTNSCIAALMARRLKVPVYHMEAGNRCFDQNVPEETNRKLVDHVSDFNLVYTEHARRNLLREGLEPRRILKTGSPMREVLTDARPGIEASTVLSSRGLKENGYVVVSAHREENVDLPARLNQLLDCLDAVRKYTGLPIIFSTHPRTRKRLEALGRVVDGVDYSEPLGFFDYLRLQRDAYVVLSDSGTISEESSLLAFPAITLRDSIERPEALDSGHIVMTGLNPDDCVDAVRFVTESSRMERMSPAYPEDYEISDCSRRAVSFILSTAHRSHQWAGIRV